VQGQLRKETHKALLAHCWPSAASVEILFESIVAGDDRAYGSILSGRWGTATERGDALAIVEPDIVVRPDVIAEFLDNPAPYLCFPYAWTTNIGPALGCTRFSAAFIARYPTLMAEAQLTGVGWQQLDVVIMRRLLADKYGEQPLVLLPPVEHLNERKRLLPDADPTPLMSVPVGDIGNLA
jgi:hypothetical protein